MEQKFYANNNLFKTSALAVALLFASCGSRSDEDLQSDIQKRLQEKNRSNSSYRNVKATVKDGTVQLAGECEGGNCADSVVSLAEGVDGVKDVENNIRQVKGETDLTLRTSAQGIISKYEGVQADVAAGVVVLRGTIKREQIQPLMNELSALQPKKIDNQLAIQ